MVRGIILAGGTGSRLGSLSKIVNKHMLPVGNFPMIYHPLSQLLYNGIKEICIVSGLFHLGSLISLLGSGKKFNCNFTYKVQDDAGGIAEALSLCEDFSKNDHIIVFLGDNIFGEPIEIKDLNNDAILYIKKVQDPQRFGIAEVDHMKKLIDIEEKPKNPKSDLAVTGAYLYSTLVWAAIKNINKSHRGELEISDVNRWLIKNGSVITSDVCYWWTDAGTPESYKQANLLAWDKLDYKLIKILNNFIK